MIYPKELQLTEVEEKAILGGLQVTITLPEVLDDIDYTFEEFSEDDDECCYYNLTELVKKIKKSLELEFEGRRGSVITTELDFEEQVALKLKLENRAVFRKTNKVEIDSVVIVIGAYKYICSNRTIELGDFYYRPGRNEIFRGSGYKEGDLKVVNTTDPAVLPHL